MATEIGSITHSREPIIPLRLSNDLVVECVVDTGFSGGLMLPAETLGRLGIPIIGKETFELVSGQFLVASLALMEIQWLGERRLVRVVVSEGYDSLIGTELLDGNRLVINYVENTVTLTDESV
jgi:clan AA aspartic protease